MLLSRKLSIANQPLGEGRQFMPFSLNHIWILNRLGLSKSMYVVILPPVSALNVAWYPEDIVSF